MQNDIVKQPTPAKPASPPPAAAAAPVHQAPTTLPPVPKESQAPADRVKKEHGPNTSSEDHQKSEPPQTPKVAGPPSAAGPITFAVIVCVVLIAMAIYVKT